MANTVWGIDVSPTSLKAVRLTGTTATPVLEEIVRIDFGVVSPDEDENVSPHIREGLTEFAATHDLNGAKIATSLPSHTTFNRFIKLPPVDESRINEIVQYEAQQHIPFPLDEVIWSYERIERDYEPGEEVEVILFAIKKEIVNRFMGNLDAAGIDAEIIQFSPVALYNFVQYDQPVDRTTAILDIGANNCDLLIIEDERYWIRNVPLAASDFTKALQDKLKLEFEKAETLKKKASKSKKAKQYYQIMKPVLRDLVQEIHRSVGFYKSMSEGSQLEQVYLTGGGAKTLRLKDFIGENLQLPSGVISGFQRIQKGGTLDQATLEKEAPTIAPALGLGLQALGASRNTINLIPSEVKKEKQLKRKRPYVIAAGVIFALFIAFWYLSGSNEISNLNSEIQTANNILDQVSTTNEQVKQARDSQKLKNLKSVTGQLANWKPNRKLPVKFWNEIQKALPDNVALRNRLNTKMIAYYKSIDHFQKSNQDGSNSGTSRGDFTYQAFRNMNLNALTLKSNTKDLLNDIREEVLGIEKQFVWLLEVNYEVPHVRNGGEEETAQSSLVLEITCAIVSRGSPSKDRKMIEETISEPIRKALNIPDRLENVTPANKTISSLDLLALQDDNRRRRTANIGNGEQTNIFRPVTIEFTVDPARFSADGTYNPK